MHLIRPVFQNHGKWAASITKLLRQILLNVMYYVGLWHCPSCVVIIFIILLYRFSRCYIYWSYNHYEDYYVYEDNIVLVKIGDKKHKLCWWAFWGIQDLYCFLILYTHLFFSSALQVFNFFFLFNSRTRRGPSDMGFRSNITVAISLYVNELFISLRKFSA